MSVSTRSGVPSVGVDELEAHRRELTGYCYRMLGSAFEAEDAVQETLVRAWKGIDAFEGRSAVRSWLYRIATNVCLDMLRSRQRRALPIDTRPAATADSDPGPKFLDRAWLTPVPDARVVPEEADPAEVAASRDSIRLAFVAALQYLPARQRAVLILHEVLKWRATEVAELLETSVAAVNSALQRARATLAAQDLSALPTAPSSNAELLARYVDAFERYDIESLVALLHEDAVMTMPPYDFWLRGRDQMGRWFVGQGIGCRGSRLIPVQANGQAAFGTYRIDPAGGWAPFSVQVLEVVDGRITAHLNFLDTELFDLFGLPLHLDG